VHVQARSINLLISFVSVDVLFGEEFWIPCPRHHGCRLFSFGLFPLYTILDIATILD